MAVTKRPSAAGPASGSGKGAGGTSGHWNRNEYVVTVFSGFEWFIRRVGWPTFAFFWCPMTVALMWYTYHLRDGSALAVFHDFINDGFVETLWNIYRPIWKGSPRAWAIVGTHAATQLALMRLLPGKKWEGPMTGSGHVPIYKANGVQAFVTTLVLFFTAVHGFNLFNPAIVYDEWGHIFGGLTFFSFAFCAFLYVKGRFFPSSPDHSLSGNPIWDYYWGTELYPRILGWDVKVFTNCRFGMMGWAMMIICYAYKQHDLGGLTDSMLVAVSLQLTYIFKFYVWESGYLRSLDIMHDRAGYYICWGCLVWLPSIYSSSTLFLVPRHIVLGPTLAWTIFGLGFVFIMTNWAADHQRHRVREQWFNKQPITVWGKKATIIETHYKSEQGDIKNTILLADGFWGIARHFHYIPEILGSICWVLPCGFTHVQPWFYIIYLTILLFERGTRDDVRCALKYGDDWKKYCALVPYRFVPGIF